MHSGEERIQFGAKWILPIHRAPLADAALTVCLSPDGNTIAGLTPGGRAEADIDLGDVILLPALINAHTHLEFSDLQRPIGYPGISITDWIPKVIAKRISATSASSAEAIIKGLDESCEFGSVALGEIATSPWFNEDIASRCQRIHVTSFIERLGNSQQDVQPRISEAQKWIKEFSATPYSMIGISPHAPYSVNPKLFEQLVAWAARDRLPVAMHLAESQEELQWLRTGDGPFLDLLESLSALNHRPNNQRPLDFLKALATTQRCLVVHGNYLDIEELDFVSRAEADFHLVYCPRTHEFFGHKPYPLPEALKRGINVAVGTDSRCSNPDLSVWRELKSVFRQHPQIDPTSILRFGTVNAARALGLQNRFGSLQIGRQAELLQIAASVESGDCPVETALASEHEPEPLDLVRLR